MISIIFDLDQTLLDTSLAEMHRNRGKWDSVYAQIPNFTYYAGLEEVFAYIEQKAIKCCIVTNSPSNYCTKVTTHWNIKCDFHICYHDTKRRKPYPDPYLLAINKFDNRAENILAVGDRNIDITAAHAAGIKSVACLWGTERHEQVLAENPTYVAKTPNDLLEIIKNFQKSKIPV